jgi:hypothetical protein
MVPVDHDPISYACLHSFLLDPVVSTLMVRHPVPTR